MRARTIVWPTEPTEPRSPGRCCSLRELIFSGAFAPGERMSELPLVERLGVSRTPLRLALAGLEHEGLLRGLARRRLRRARVHRGDIPTRSSFAACSRAPRRASRPSGAPPAATMRALRTINDAIAGARAPGRLRVLRALRRPERALPRPAAEDAPAARCSSARSSGIVSLPFAGPSAASCSPRPSCPSRARSSCVAHRHHVWLIEAIERREGARAESLAREHARIALAEPRDRAASSGGPRADARRRARDAPGRSRARRR